VQIAEFVARRVILNTTLLLVSGCATAFAMAVLGQRSDRLPLDAITKAPAYEIVSVKPARPGCPGMQTYSPPGRIQDRCVTLWGLLFNAYDLRPSDSHTLGLPGWANAARFDIDAKADDDTTVALQKLPREEQEKQRRLMLQALLADRFKLHVHTETREQQIYALVIAKGGAKLKPWPADQKPSGISWGGSRIDVRGSPIERLVFCLSDELDRVVVDKTGLTGDYDITLKWTPDNEQDTLDVGPTLFTALKEQLGLKLVATKGPVDTFVVDHVERPAEN